jgi:putative membrane protein
VTRRWPPGVFDRGGEPDPRFSLANERTFLAGIRTSLALLAAGVALEALRLPIQEDLRLVAALIFIGLACLHPVQAWTAWSRTELAMRLRGPMPSPGVLAAVLAAGVVAAGILLLVGLVLR